MFLILDTAFGLREIATINNPFRRLKSQNISKYSIYFVSCLCRYLGRRYVLCVNHDSWTKDNMSLYLTFWSPEYINKILLLGVSKCSSWRLSAELPKFHRLVTTKIFSALSGNFLLVAAGPGRSGQVVPAGGRGYYGWWPYYPTTPTHTLCLLTSGYVALCWLGWAGSSRPRPMWEEVRGRGWLGRGQSSSREADCLTPD